MKIKFLFLLYRVVYHKYWLCQHSQRNKVNHPNVEELTPRNTQCEAKINILIKKNPPLCGIITIMNKHNHTINTSGSLKYLRINSEVSSNMLLK